MKKYNKELGYVEYFCDSTGELLNDSEAFMDEATGGLVSTESDSGQRDYTWSDTYGSWILATRIASNNDICPQLLVYITSTGEITVIEE